MNSNQYLLWIQSGVTSVAKVVSLINNTAKLEKPHMIINMQYGVTESGELVNPHSPDSVKSRFNAEMSPYLFNEYVGDGVVYTMEDISSTCYTILTDEELPLVKQYLDISK